MKATHGLVLSALLSTMAGCAANGSDATAAASAQSIVAAPGPGGTEMYVSWMARQELVDALAPTPTSPDFTDVIVPNVMRVQHHYSVAAVRIEAASWALATDLPVEDAPWSLHSSLGVTFPRDFATSSEADDKASHIAAEKLFNALVRATETTAEVVHGVQATTRASARKTFSCTKTVSRDNPDSFRCTIAGVTQVGGNGLLWNR